MSEFDPDEKIVIKDGEIILYHRMDRGNPMVWQAVYKLPDGSGTKRKSTKKKDRDEAKTVALKEWEELRFKEK